MSTRAFLNSFGPGLTAIVAGTVAQLVWRDPAATIMASGAGAVAGILVFSNSAQIAPGPDAVEHPVVDPPAEPKPSSVTARDASSATAAVLDDLPLAILLVDTARQITYANLLARELFGLVDTSAHLSALRNPLLLQMIERSFGSGTTDEAELVLPRQQDRHLFATVRSVEPSARRRRGDRMVMLVIEDRSAIRRTRELHRDFVANASHELKTPLASIAVLIETLQGHARNDEVARARFLSMMSAQSDRMKRLIEDLLSLNRIELNARIAPRQQQPLGLIVSEAVETLTPIAQSAGISLDLDGLDAVPDVLGAREELAQTFGNLIDNAIKYGRSGGTVTIRAVTDPERDGMIGIAISDDGPGIAREHIPRLTERFYRVSVSRSRERGGTGLGLAIVKHIVSRHRGEMQIESELGAGSVFTVWLPVLKTPPEFHQRPPMPEPADPATSIPKVAEGSK